MQDSQTQFIDVSRLRVGMYVYLDLGWMAHPFALNSFKIQSQEQIDTLRSLGIERIRYSPEKSDPAPASGARPDARMAPDVPHAATTGAAAGVADPSAGQAADTLADQSGAESAAECADSEAARQQRRQLIATQRAELQHCERQFSEATRTYRDVVKSVTDRPTLARGQVETMVAGLVTAVTDQEESCIRLLSENAGEKTSLHSINVTVLSLLLGKAMSLSTEDMNALGVGALLHDIGKISLPDRLRWKDESFSTVELHVYREHVGHGVEFAARMKLDPAAQVVIAQHHELADGSGYPQRLAGERIAPLARIVGLVNHYDNLCNPGNPARAATPHDALSLIYARARRQFDGATLALFIRMMGVYPPGSVIELSDGRHAMVVSVNSSRPLRPRVIIHDPAVPADEALIVDLEAVPTLGIRRSLKPLQLPKAAFDYLSPRQRMCYFFEPAREVPGAGGEA